MGETLDTFKTLVRFPWAMNRFRQRKMTFEQAKQILRERMERREETFLRLAERGIYGYAPSPYRAMLELAGCELGDLRSLVKEKGLENTLRALRAEGVYLTFEEYKGRTPPVRRGKTIPMPSGALNNPGAAVDYHGETGGSTGVGTQTSSNLDRTWAWIPHYMMMFSAHQVLGSPTIIYRGILPDTSGIGACLPYTKCGMKVQKWFSHIDPHDVKLRYPLMTYYMVAICRLYGVPVPLPEYLPLDHAGVAAELVWRTIQTSGKCLVNTQVSRALRISIAAQQAGLDLTGAVFFVAGEPPTPAKVHEIEKSGARSIPMYGMGGLGRVAWGCANPVDSSDVHFMHDSFALITHSHRVPGFDIEVPAFNFTSLTPQAPTIFLNVQVDDYGIVEERGVSTGNACGCEFEKLGFTTHLRDIHSYSKLTGEGVSLVGSEMMRILEEVLPARFGGSALDYQLLEQEDEKGFTRLYLIISPRIAIEDEQKVIQVVLNAMRESSNMADAARTVWQQAGIFSVKRMEPVWTRRGKFPSLRRERLSQQAQENLS